MSNGIRLFTTNTGVFDLDIDGGDFVSGDGFETAIWISLFTDARATESQVLTPEHRRGWPGNMVSPVDGRQLGGYLWLIDQRRLNQATLNEAIDYARSALNWFVADSVAKSVEVTGSIVPATGIQLDVTITSFSGETDTHYVKLWEATGAN
jgi:phage gp46-like protein